MACVHWSTVWLKKSWERDDRGLMVRRSLVKESAHCYLATVSPTSLGEREQSGGLWHKHLDKCHRTSSSPTVENNIYTNTCTGWQYLSKNTNESDCG